MLTVKSTNFTSLINFHIYACAVCSEKIVPAWSVVIIFTLTEKICLKPQDRMLRRDICSIIERHVKVIYPGKVYTYVTMCSLVSL